MVLATFLLAGLAQATADSVPKLDLTPTCRGAATNDPLMRQNVKSCLRAEDVARAQLARTWKRFPREDRGFCTQSATMGGIASYVQLLTCLELRQYARTLKSSTGASASAK